jgi:hypothetical protein
MATATLLPGSRKVDLCASCNEDLPVDGGILCCKCLDDTPFGCQSQEPGNGRKFLVSCGPFNLYSVGAKPGTAMANYHGSTARDDL